MKLFIDQNCVLNREMLEEEFTLVDKWQAADRWLYFSTYRYKSPAKQSVIIQVEPPLADHRIMLYNSMDDFLAVFTFNPSSAARNQHPIATNYGVYPYYPRPELRRVVSAGLRDRRVYYAGSRNSFIGTPDKCDSVNLYPVRAAIVEALQASDLPTTVYGSGWGAATGPAWTGGKGGDWQKTKQEEIAECKADFVLCLENSYFSNYISEKIHDGFASDRVVLYLGAPNISRYVPPGCFIDLQQFFDASTKKFNHVILRRALTEMTEKFYNEIRWRAREFCEGLNEVAFLAEQRATTKRVIEILK